MLFFTSAASPCALGGVSGLCSRRGPPMLQSFTTVAAAIATAAAAAPAASSFVATVLLRARVAGPAAATLLPSPAATGTKALPEKLTPAGGRGWGGAVSKVQTVEAGEVGEAGAGAMEAVRCGRCCWSCSASRETGGRSAGTARAWGNAGRGGEGAEEREAEWDGQVAQVDAMRRWCPFIEEHEEMIPSFRVPFLLCTPPSPYPHRSLPPPSPYTDRRRHGRNVHTPWRHRHPARTAVAATASASASPFFACHHLKRAGHSSVPLPR